MEGKKATNLFALSPLDGRYGLELQQVAELFSEHSLQKKRLQIEVEWLVFLAGVAEIHELNLSSEDKSSLRKLYLDFSLDYSLQIKEFEQTTHHDVKAIELFLRKNLPSSMDARLARFIHFGMTSEDTNSLAYALVWQEFYETLALPLLQNLLTLLQAQGLDWKKYPMVARTHGQMASSTTLGKEWAVFYHRLLRQFQTMKKQKVFAKFNGATGNHSAWLVAYPDLNWWELTEQFLQSFKVQPQYFTTQIEPHDFLAEICHNWIRWNTIWLDFARDVWGYISLGYFTQQNISGEVGSSTMPHKLNPIHFENAEGNLGLANALFEFMATKLPVSRWQRDLSDSTVLRSVGSAFGYSILAMKSLEKGLKRIIPNPNRLQEDLEQAWEVLLEAVQTLVRRYGELDTVDASWQMFRGKKLTQSDYQQYVGGLPIPEVAKAKLAALTPSTYTGYASQCCGGEKKCTPASLRKMYNDLY